MSVASAGVKRPLNDDTVAPQEEVDMTSDTIELAEPGKMSSAGPASPMSSISSIPSRSLDVPSMSLEDPAPGAGQASGTPSTAPQKRRKLTAAEKEAAKAEKERKQEEKEAERQKKLEEKKQRDEEREEKRRVKDAEKAEKDAERAAKDQERREKQEKRDAEKKAKDDEKRALEEAKAKKERSQGRLTSFFGKPKETLAPSSPARSRETSVVPQNDEEASPAKTPAKGSRPALFLPFEPPTHAIVAPYNRNIRDSPAVKHAVDALESCMRGESQPSNRSYNKRSLADAFQPPVKRVRYEAPTPLKSIIASLKGTQSQPIDLTAAPTFGSSSARDELRKVKIKSFKYREDVRPPYIGTFTKMPDRCSVKQLARQPFQHGSTSTNYDYDSEAEWEEPEEGEDLNSEGEEEPEDDDIDDMDGFLDDDGAEAIKRQQVYGDMEPKYTDIHWASSLSTRDAYKVDFRTESGKIDTIDLKEYTIETLIEQQPLYSIDPYSTAYWAPPAPSTGSSSAPGKPGAAASTMAPPRLPLNSIPGATNIPIGQQTLSGGGVVGIASPAKPSAVTSTGVPTSSVKSKGKPSAPLPIELFDDFKKAIDGSSLTKLGLIEVLKSQFPSVSKSTVQETLEQMAERVGAKATEKRWRLKE